MPEQNTQIIKAEHTPLYTFVRGLCLTLFHTVMPLRYHNIERLHQLQPPCILLGNHRCMIDPMALAAPIRQQEVRFVGKRELTQNRLLKWVVEHLHMIAVGRGETDMGAMRACMQVLREGRILGIFPEGTRHQPELMQEVESGAALLAMRARVPLVPVYIHGKIRFFHRTEVYVGEPIPMDDLLAQGVNSESVKLLCERIRDTYYAMRDAAKAET